jgi:CHAT domain-containing protein
VTFDQPWNGGSALSNRGAELRAVEHASFRPNGNLNIVVPPDPQDATPLPSPTIVANTLPLLRDETVIAYAAFPDGIAIWVYDDRGIFSRWISIPSIQVEELALRFRRLCSDPTSDLSALRTTARSLYDLLIAPVEDRFVAGRALLVEPVDFLTAVPWEALVDREGHYLVERTPVTVVPGLYRETRLRPGAAVTSETPVLVVSVPVAREDGLAPLADVENEAQEVSQSFSSAHLLQGDDATLAAIRRELRGKRVFHFAGHALASPQRTLTWIPATLTIWIPGRSPTVVSTMTSNNPATGVRTLRWRRCPVRKTLGSSRSISLGIELTSI